jgi:Super-infection exclusion protein B
MSESIDKILDFLGKHAWAVWATIAFVLFIPEDLAKKIHLFDFRTEYVTILWIMFVLSAALWISSLFRYFDKRFVDGWLSKRKMARDRKTSLSNHLKTLSLRLKSLSESERMWIKYCLYYNVQTLNSQLDNSTAQSLLNKQILSQGSGNALDLPFHIRDDAWRFLLENSANFLSEQELADNNFPAVLEEYKKTLIKQWMAR